MAEYIEREAAIKLFNFAVLDCLGMEPTIRAGDIVKALESIPAADVRPVVRGKWRFEIGDGKTCVDGWVCSACNCGFHTNVPYFEGFNFCPNCGADMREKS